MTYRISDALIEEQNAKGAAAHEDEYAALQRKLARAGRDIEPITKQVAAFGVAVPTWGVGTGGTRFARFPGPGEPRGIFDKLEDCATIQQLTRATPTCSPHFPWDKVADYRELNERASALGLSFDAWLFHPQIGDLIDLARAFPGTKIMLDHCGGPIGLGSYSNRAEVFKVWKASILEVAKCPNVFVKLGGLAMRLLGYDFHERPMPPSSEQAAAAWRPYIETCIEAFGPERGMFESNFPPDKGQCSYQVIFNAFKRIAAPYSEAEKTALFSRTATDFYRLKLG